MLVLFKAYIEKPADMSNKDFYTLWRKESEAALAAKEAGVVKAIWKVAGKPEVVVVMDVESADALDNAFLSLPIWQLGYAHIVKDVEIIPLRSYENWAEDLKKLSEGY